MSQVYRIINIFTVAACFLYVGASCEAAQLQTLESLQTAVATESNAYNRYNKFADRADQQGYPSVAKLFRSVAFSELMHMKNHTTAIEELGGKLNPIDLKQVTLYSTLENLKTSARDELKDELKMYIVFANQAFKDGLLRAQDSFKFAYNAEIQHKKLFESGLTLLGPKNVDYYVDIKDGDIVEQALGQVPPKSKFMDSVYVKAAN